jgi:hypothetical protein
MSCAAVRPPVTGHESRLGPVHYDCERILCIYPSYWRLSLDSRVPSVLECSTRSRQITRRRRDRIGKRFPRARKRVSYIEATQLCFGTKGSQVTCRCIELSIADD